MPTTTLKELAMDISKEQFARLPVFECFGSLEDYRKQGRTKYSLIEIIIISICAILCGAQGWTQVERFGLEKEEWLKTFLSLPHGIPAHDTFGDVFAMISPVKFRECFMKWISRVSEITKGEIIAIDGKTLRRSHDRRRGKESVHLVNAFAVKNGLFLAHEKVDNKSNEIKAIPKLLKLLEIKGCIITMDAMGCQKGIANLIKEREGEYVLAVKGNQGKLHETIEKTFTKANILQYEPMVYKNNETVEKDHGRVEQRSYCFLPLMYIHKFKKHWKGLQTIVEVESRIYSKGQEKIEKRYYISSLELKKYEIITEAIRKHWHVENRLHWCLDVSLREDECRVRRENGAENFSLLRKFTLNTFRLKEEVRRESIGNLRFKAALNSNFLAQLIGF